MTSQEEFQSYKADFDKKQLKRARSQAIVLGFAAMITVLAMLYGLINSIEAGAQRDTAITNEQTAMEQHEIAAKISSELADCRKELDGMKQIQEKAIQDAADLAKKAGDGVVKSKRK